jgi:hypothetical protein
MDLFMHIIEFEARCVGYTAHLAENDGHGADGRNVREAIGRVEMADDVFHGIRNEVLAVDEGEEAAGRWVCEIVDLEAEFGDCGEVGEHFLSHGGSKIFNALLMWSGVEWADS